MHNTTIGERIKMLRKSHGLSQAELAEKLRVTQGFISKVEINRAQFTLEHIITLATIFEVDLNLLLTGKVMEGVAESQLEYGARDVVKEKINLMLDGMDKEKRRDVLKYVEEKKLLTELLAERQNKKAG